MTSSEFVIWLKGFTEGAHEHNLSPKQWDLLKERLAEVKDEVIPTGTLEVRTPDTVLIKPLPYYPNPLTDPFRVTCDGTNTTLTFTTGSMMTYTTGKQLLKDSEYNYTLKKKDGKSV